MSDDEFLTRGLCAQTDPEAFFPDNGGPTKAAKRICQGCEVRVQCLAYALKHRERYGVWGGLSERERRRALAAQGTPSHKQQLSDTRRDTARRMHAAGYCKADIVRALGSDYRRVTTYLSDTEQPVEAR
jgi:hypothetical protein